MLGRQSGRGRLRRGVNLRRAASRRMSGTSSPVAKPEVAPQPVLGAVRHLPRPDEHRVHARGQEPEERERKIRDVKVTHVAVLLVDEVRDENEDIDRAPADGE